MALDHPTVQHVAGRLSAAGVSGEVVSLPDAARTAVAAADQLGCDVGAIANSLVFAVDDCPVLVLSSGAQRVDVERLATLLGASTVARATPEFVRRHTGMAIGGVAPFGHPEPIRTVVDHALAAFDIVWAAAGHPHTVFPTSHAELLRLTGGVSADVAVAATPSPTTEA